MPVLQPREFDGKAPWREYLAHFEHVARANHWTEATKAEQLLHNLTGAAGAVLGDREGVHLWTFQEMKEEMESVFGPKSDRAVALAVELRQRKLQPGESLHELAAYIRRSVRIAYADKSNEAREEIMVEVFRNALADPRMIEKIIIGRPSTLRQAVDIACMEETLRTTANQVAGFNGGGGRRHRMEEVDKGRKGKPDAATKEVAEVQRELARLRDQVKILEQERAKGGSVPAELPSGGDAQMQSLLQAVKDLQQRTSGFPQPAAAEASPMAQPERWPDTPRPGGQKRQASNAGLDRVCYRCGEPGHFIRECPLPACPTCGRTRHKGPRCSGRVSDGPLN